MKTIRMMIFWACGMGCFVKSVCLFAEGQFWFGLTTMAAFYVFGDIFEKQYQQYKAGVSKATVEE